MKNLARAVLPIATGRINPLHIEHQNQVFTPLLNLSKGNIFRSQSDKLVPYVFLMGSSGDDRNIINNPFSYDQRVDMALIAMEEIYRTTLWESLSPELQSQLCTTPIRQLIDLDATFPKHTDNKERNNPPKLDSLTNFILDHCQKHKLPTEDLFFRSLVKPEELVREYQLFGKRYYDCHQMIAVAQHLGTKYEQNLIEDTPDHKIVSSTQLRINLAENFPCLSPKILLYVQKELLRALINNRRIGDSKENDLVTQTDNFFKDLVNKDQMLTFDSANPKISNIPPDLSDRFHAYIIKAEEPYKTTTSTKTKQLQINNKGFSIEHN